MESSPKKKILLVEDDKDILFAMTRFFHFHKFQVSTARNGKEALEALGEMARIRPHDLPNCAIVDWMMPEIDGKAFVEAIRSHTEAALRELPLFVTTAKAEVEARREWNIKEVEVIFKPCSLKVLLRKAQKYCDFRQIA